MARPHRFPLVIALTLVHVLGLPSGVTMAALPAEIAVPEALEPWVDWVLHDEDRSACPFGVGHETTRVCAWPGRLELDLEPRGGRFAQTWELHAEQWVPLPGADAAWPQQVRVGGEPAAVVERGGRPAIRLGPGTHELTGRFVWTRRPEVLPIPPETGLLSLQLNGEAVAHPGLDPQGRLWLGQRRRPAAAGEPDRLSLEVMRRIDDEIPLQVRTRLALDVSGQARELTLGPAVLPNGIPLRIDSRLPARLLEQTVAGSGARWMLQVQVRPGRWVVTVDAHYPGPVDALTLTPNDAPWPTQEVWAFAARPDLRQVEVRGAEQIDPRQTRLPADWQRLPAYLMQAGETLSLETLRRGALGADRLRLERELRLDYSGNAFSVRDRLGGQLEQRWRLEAQPMLELGQVRVGGEPRFITRLGTGETPGLAGVEVRRGRLDLTADARVLSGPVGLGVALPASGWALSLDGIETQLHLPPGWDLLAVQGVDNLPDAWLARWSLLDIFLVLVIALGIGRLWGWPWGLVALLTLVLVWPEPGAPRWVWLHVLVGAALLRLLPAAPSRTASQLLRTLLKVYYRGALLALALITVPFLVTEMRDGLFPQLDRPGTANLARIANGMRTAPALKQEAPFESEMAAADEARAGAPAAKRAAPASHLKPPAEPLPTLAPGALVQTGTGVPDWTWRRFTLSWNGPVTPEQQLQLWLLPPAAGLILAALRVVLVLLLGLRLADWLPPLRRRGEAAPVGVAGLVLAGSLLFAPGSDVLADTPAELGRRAQPGAAAPIESLADSEAGAFPPAELLHELKRRLLKPPDCLPRCVEIPRMGIAVSGDRLRLLLEVDAATSVALPVPGSPEGWRPTELRLDGEWLSGLRRDASGSFLVPVPDGHHRMELVGPLPGADQVDIPLPLRPRQVEVRVARPWQLEGVDADGRPGDQLRLLRERATPAATADSRFQEGGHLPPLLRVTRTLRLGLDWSLDTDVERLSPTDSAVTLRIPLVPGEAVTTPGRQVDDGRVLVSLPPGRSQTGWSSTLKPVDRLTLTATEDPRLAEVWRLEVSPVWHLDASGPPAVQNLGPADRWLPTWRPWPGEQLELSVSRPAGVAGPTLTLDRSRYLLKPGRRISNATLELDLRTSQGGRHQIRLPEGAELMRLTVDGQPRPLALQGRALDLPLVPGSQQVLLGWREPTPLAGIYRPAAVEIGTPGVNAETQVQLGRDRWLLWTAGPGIGPAVQFWGLLIVLAVAAAVLGRSPLTPLGFASWLLLGIGLSQAGVWVAALVTLWLFALGLRRQLDEHTKVWRFNLAQVGLVVLSLAALSALIAAVQQGLLGDPAMQVAGYGSTATDLRWYLDRHSSETVPVTVVSVPIWIYRALMLAWALWLAWRLLDWLRWGWQGFAEPTFWRPAERKATRGSDDQGSTDCVGT